MTFKLEEHKILMVDDDQHILELLMTCFEKEGFQKIITAVTGTEALLKTNQESPDIILLDVMLPDIDGFTLCSKIRSHTNAPILFLTAKTTDLDKLQGFSFGGDDYITKPFNPLEVVARVKAQLKRTTQFSSFHSPKEVYEYEDFIINPNTSKLIVKGERIELPTQEMKLLIYFCKHPNQILSKHKIYKDVWGEFYGGDSTVMVHIRRLREKLEADPSRPKWIKTVRGQGYIFEAPTSGDSL
ncbi:response regulator transcription factor [Bacillus atrophaeus]|uniref:response regulator transcription factor n=1 Tax=Bacillus atrophaeus TaxID=1452 RepID=UPI00123BB8A9|nr:response regulator transcription factor [Bacillus atrophaeus]KAA6450015.1 DNA-binding response regulator [Bacillus atrophaeus]